MPLQLGRRRLRRTLRRTPATRTPSVAIIGAGLSGIGMAIQLRRAGVDDVVVFEKAGEVGGTWRDNHYPGSGCDVPSHLYSFSFAPKRDWTRAFAGQAEILDYARDLAELEGVRSCIRFHTEVAEAEFDEAAGRWRLRTNAGDEHVADILVAAVGQLNRPAIPDLPGLPEFRGALFHSARWDHGVELRGRDVAVIGSGASAIQFVPEVAKDAASVTIFQRTPNYVAPKPDRVFGPRRRWILEHLAPAAWAYRWRIYWSLELRWLMFRRDSALSRLATRRFGSEIRKALVGDRLTEAAVVPDYAIGCKRILISNDWYPTLLAPTVSVETSPITRVTADGIETAAGTSHRADAIIFGTGFETTDFLAPIRVTGRGGRRLDAAWRDGAEAYLGLCVPGFPNLFLLYGPNTNLGHNSILFMVERQIEYVLQCLARQVAGRSATTEVSAESLAGFERRIERRMAATAWVGACRSWYKTASGRVTNNWPGFTVRYWLDTLVPRRAAFVADRPPVPDPSRPDRAPDTAPSPPRR